MQTLNLFVGFALISVFSLPALPAFHAPPALHAQEASFRGASSELVVLPVIVKDKQGRYVSDLQKERFVVYDNARRMSIDLFTNEDTPVTVGLIVDASGSMRVKLGEVIAAAVAFARSSNPDDELFAVRFNDDVEEVVRERRFLLASDLSALEAAMSALRPRGRTALYDALIAGLDHLNDASRPRSAHRHQRRRRQRQPRDARRRPRARAQIERAIYTIGVYDPDEADKNRGALKALARATGGERFEPASPGQLQQVCKRIARELRSGYTIGYVPPDRDGLFHRVRVVIEPAARGLDVRTRPGYFAARSVTPSSQP